MPEVELEIDVEGGKYTFISYRGDYRIHVLRYKELWLIIEQGHKAILCLMHRVAGLDTVFTPAELKLLNALRKLPAHYIDTLSQESGGMGDNSVAHAFGDLRDERP